MRIIQPRAGLKPQTHTTAPVTGDATLVDDPVALVDDSTALVGGASTSHSDMVLNMKTAKPVSNIRIKR